MVLLMAVCGASFFMVVESAKYYENFYLNSEAWKALYLAILLEIFALILVIVKIKDHKIYTFVSKFILIPLVFIAIISAAGMQAIKPTLDSVASIQKESGLVELLKQEVVDLRADKELFDKQKQKRNTAIAAAERRNAIKTLTEVMQKDAVSNTGTIALLNILLLFGIRIVVQIVNLHCANAIGITYREYRKTKLEPDIEVEPEDVSYKNIVTKEFPDAKCVKRKNEYVVLIENIKCGKGIVSQAAWKDAYKQQDKIRKVMKKLKEEKKKQDRVIKIEENKKKINEKVDKVKDKIKSVGKSTRQLVWIEKLKETLRKKQKGKENVDVGSE